MVRDGAPAGWTAPMRLVAQTIADDARDPRQPGPDDGLPWSMITIRGEFRRGKWHDGLAQRTGLSRDGISRALTALARAGYEMREQATTDKHGRPVFAYPGHRLRFRVPPLKPRDEPIDSTAGRSADTPTTRSADIPTTRSPDSPTLSPPKVGGNAVEGRATARDRSGHSPTHSPHSPPTVKPTSSSTGPQQFPGRGPRDGQGDDDSEARSRPNRYGWCPVCGKRYRVSDGGLLQVHGPRRDRCEGSRQPPADTRKAAP
jgi:hypothetical protein